MTWIANILVIVGLILVGDKKRSAFLFTFAGELIWAVVGILRYEYDLSVICFLFAGLALVNWSKWRDKT